MKNISIEIVYGTAQQQGQQFLDVPENTTVGAALQQAGFSEKDLKNGVGIYGAVIPLDTVLQEEDRIELYRPLQIDPKEARRLRAKRT